MGQHQKEKKWLINHRTSRINNIHTKHDPQNIEKADISTTACYLPFGDSLQQGTRMKPALSEHMKEPIEEEKEELCPFLCQNTPMASTKPSTCHMLMDKRQVWGLLHLCSHRPGAEQEGGLSGYQGVEYEVLSQFEFWRDQLFKWTCSTSRYVLQLLPA